MTATFTPTDTVDYTTATSSVTLTVNQALLTVMADNKTRSYGVANPPLTYSFTGFVNSDSATAINGAPLLTTAATTASPIGSYPINITAGTLAASNYTLQFIAGTLTITDASLTVKANDATKIYGAPLPPFTGSINGAANGDTFVETFMTNATTLSTPGAYTITPSATGANLADYSITTVPGTLTITQAPSITTLSTSASPVLAGANVTFTATVASTTTGVPTGTVTFFDGATALATVPLVAGEATYSTTALAVGSHTITATYSGDANFTPSTSSQVTQVVNPIFTLSATPQTLTIKDGEAGQVAIFVTPGAGFTGTITFSCTDLPHNAACIFDPQIASFANGDGFKTISLVIEAHRVSAPPSVAQTREGMLPTLPALAFWLPGAALSGFGLRRKHSARQRQMLLLAVFALGLGGLMGLTGCGSGSAAATPGTYTIQVVATSGTQQQIVPLTVTIK